MLLRTRDDVRAWRADVGRVGFVPNTGAVHEGPLSLVRLSDDENEETIVSIFVPPRSTPIINTRTSSAPQARLSRRAA